MMILSIAVLLMVAVKTLKKLHRNLDRVLDHVMKDGLWQLTRMMAKRYRAHVQVATDLSGWEDKETPQC